MANFEEAWVTDLFTDFDFTILHSPDFKEDAVREELITPLLRSLEYSASGDNKIIRSKGLKHPFVHIGTRRQSINIIPDYLLIVNKENKWILDAKASNEEIKKGANLEQAFSYAIHPDVRVSLYALCNGKEFIVFHISKIEPILYFKLQEIGKYWEQLYKLLSPIGLTKPELLDYKPDFGLWLLKLGTPLNMISHFPFTPINFIARITDDMYSTVVGIKFDDIQLAISFDFSKERLEELLLATPASLKDILKERLSKAPFRIELREPLFVNIEAKIGENVHTNDVEDYLPLIVTKFSL